MLAFTPEVEHALAWFDTTHELRNADGRLWWSRTGLPGPGALSEQDARLMDALDLLQSVHDDLLRQRPKEKRETDG